MRDEAFYNRVSNDRICSRQMDEMIGLARGLCADGVLNHAEVEFLQKWLAANLAVNDQPLLQTLWRRVGQILSDGTLDKDEQADLFEILQKLGGERTELGEVLKPSSLPLCSPAPNLTFEGQLYAFTGTFSFGQRKDCERAVESLGGFTGSLTMKTDCLVIGEYVTESWKHSSMGNKILKAADLRAKGIPISIVCESHWQTFL